jgi:acyl-CoA thioester hydrolase
LQYNQTVEVHTHVADVQRVTSQRSYTFLVEDGSTAARGWTNWIFMDTSANRPTRIPLEVKAAFFPEGAPEEFPPAPPYPTPPEPPAGAYRMRRKVLWRDLDPVQHVNNAAYLDYTSDCGFESIAAVGWPWQRLDEAGMGIYIRRLHAQYLQPALYGDEVEICTWIYDVKRSLATRHYTIHRTADQALLAQVNTLGVWVNRETGQPMRIPPAMLADFAPNIASI